MGKFKQKWKNQAMAIDPETGKRKPTREYNTWSNMMKRCYNKANAFYYVYGGKGIEVCERWHNYDNFYEDMCPVPDGLQIDRKDNSKGYFLENCRWVTLKEQSRNRGYGHFITYKGETKRLSVWAEEYGLSRGVLSDRLLKCKWSVEKALNTLVNEAKQEAARGRPLYLEYKDKAHTLKQWGAIRNIRSTAIYQRIHNRNWTIGQALGFEDKPITARCNKRFTEDTIKS